MKKEVNKTGKKLIIISALILTIIMGIAFIAGVTAVTDTTSVDPASLSLSLFKKPNPTGHVVDDSGNTIATVNIKANEEVGRVRDDFYGVNLGSFWNTNLFKEETFYSNSLKDMNVKTLRVGMRLQDSTWNGTNAIINPNTTTQLGLYKEVQYAKENKIKLLLIAGAIPRWLANTTNGYCNSPPEDNYTCSPANYSQFEQLVFDFLSSINCNSDVCEVECSNEPNFNSFWLNNLSPTNPIRAEEYIKLCNATYNGVKRFNSSINVYGPTTHVLDDSSKMILNEFMKNFANFKDMYISFHYISTDNNAEDIYNEIYRLCELNKFNCSHIYSSEWKHKNATEQNNTNYWYRWKGNVALNLLATLNYGPDKISQSYYKLESGRKYNINDTEYPLVAKMLSRPSLDNTFYPPYNVTKDFAHYHAGGNMIVNSSSNNNSIKSVASLNPQEIWHITVINTATNNINVNIDVSSTGVEAIKDLATDKVYPVISGIVNVGILNEYDVKHYEGIADYEVEEETPASVGGSSSGNGNKVVSVENLNINPNEFTAIETDKSIVISTSDIFANTNTNTNNENNKEEKEEFYGPIQSEEDMSEIEYKSLTGSLSLAISNNSYLLILIILLGSIICTSLIISIIYRKKKREAEKVKKLMGWVDKARALGYSNEKMKEMLAQYNWNKELVEKVVGK